MNCACTMHAFRKQTLTTMISSTLRMTASRAATAQQRRTMAGGHHAAPKWEGLDKTIRDVFPEDWQIAGLILTGYGSLIALYQIKSAFTAKPAVVEEVKQVAIEGGIPSSDSPEFSAFLDSDAFLQLLENEEQLTKALEA